MKMLKSLPVWPLAAPVAGWLFLFGSTFNVGGAYQILLVAGLIGSVLAAVYHAEVVAHRIGEPYGTLVLALAVTGAADNISVVTRLTLMQLETPDDMRGRTAAVNTIFIGASNQLGEFESGSVAALWGPEVSVVTGGLGTVVVALLWTRLFPTLARRDRMMDTHHA